MSYGAYASTNGCVCVCVCHTVCVCVCMSYSTYSSINETLNSKFESPGSRRTHRYARHTHTHTHTHTDMQMHTHTQTCKCAHTQTYTHAYLLINKTKNNLERRTKRTMLHMAANDATPAHAANIRSPCVYVCVCV